MASTAATRAPVNILIVDDSVENLHAVEAVLEPLGERIVRATSADEALRSLLRDEFAVILLDVRMPGTSGLETARLIKERERSRLTPIIFITAYDEDRRRVTAAYQSGAVDYLFKPLDPDILRSKVAVFAELHRSSREFTLQRRRRYADEIRRAEAEAERDRVAAVLESLSDATNAYDHDWRWTYINAAAADLWRARGKDPDPLIGRVIWAEIPELRDTRFHTEARKAQREHRLVEFEEYFAPLDQWLETRVAPTPDGFVTHSRNVTEQRRLFAAEQRARAEAEAAAASAAQANKTKSEFLATMSHELRTPLSAIIGYGELLADGITGPLNDGQREQLLRIKMSAAHLLGLIDELLTFSRFEAGQESARHEPVDVAGVLDEAHAIVWPLAKARNLRFSVIPPSDPQTIVTDRSKLRQILVNLLSNAIKFTERGEITLVARGDDDTIFFEVRDTGIGIAPEDIERIFEPFWQVEQTHSRRVGGTGLGLSVTRALAQLLGGDVGAESEVGAGSRFQVHLPRTRGASGHVEGVGGDGDEAAASA